MLPRLHSLTLLRLFAASWVVVFHFHHKFPPAPGGVWERFCGNGHFAMPLFFVLSGLVLAYCYPRIPDASAIQRFYWARFARVFPAYAVMHLLALLLMVELWHSDPVRWIYSNVLSALGLQAWFHYTFPIGLNGATWSVSVEAFFYLLFPALLPVCQYFEQRWGPLRPLVLCILFSTFIGFSDIAFETGYDSGYYILPILRLPDFILGVFLGVQLRRESKLGPRAWLGLITALVLFSVVTTLPNSWLGSTQMNFRARGLVSLAVCGLLFFCARVEQYHRPAWQSLPLRILIYLGEASYALFLVHVLLVRIMEFPVFRPTVMVLKVKGLHSEAWIVFCTISLVAAIALHELVEKPARRWLKRRHTRSAPASPALPPVEAFTVRS
ncbi:acyltransferase family protein [Actomonas aquatica]|uniref:Acyltransferase n=1 Tax=Actomonas aquatica TaxID=2866162 RepID=A0ABZ1CET5_9BACT|nr:acyltransferase [Opitutus sp. WL0086]WRQ90049.1 acyltransferase [Opitutus sp. WL0086]